MQMRSGGPPVNDDVLYFMIFGVRCLISTPPSIAEDLVPGVADLLLGSALNSVITRIKAPGLHFLPKFWICWKTLGGQLGGETGSDLGDFTRHTVSCFWMNIHLLS